MYIRPRSVKRYTPLASVVTRELHQHCTVNGCVRRPMGWGATYCTRHHHRAFENGHPEASAATIKELSQFTEWVAYGLRIYRDTPAVRIASAKAHELLHFSAQQGQHWEQYFMGRMANVRVKPGVPVDASMVLITALSYYAFEAAHPERVQNTTVRNIGLARSLIRLGKCKQKQPRKSDLTACGNYINNELGVFAIKFLDELKKRTRADNLKRERERAMSVDFTIPSTDNNTDNHNDST